MQPASGRITDPDVLALETVAASLAPGYSPPDDDPWRYSPFRWILSLPSRSKGAVGEALVAGWAESKGFDVVRSPDSQADRIIEGHRIEVKFSTLWKSGVYKFQQIREQDYSYCFCLGISPFDAHAWLLPKHVLREYVIGRMGQHTGAGGADTAWLGFHTDDPYPWMEPFGSRLSDVAALIRRNGRGPHAVTR